jgi:uracil-DNA glycosylase family 4
MITSWKKGKMMGMDLDKTTLTELNQTLLTCQLCPRLAQWRQQVAREKRRAYRDFEYWGKPVPGFGDPSARIFIVGLAPGAHGSNRTGRQFTGDGSGDFLFPALYRAGIANQPTSSHLGDGLILTNAYTAPVCRCAPPANKPTPEEMRNCLPYLKQELDLIKPTVLVALGRIAFESILRLYNLPIKTFHFAHCAEHPLPQGVTLLCSYHPSQQNTLTGKLTIPMFDAIWQRAVSLVVDG